MKNLGILFYLLFCFNAFAEYQNPSLKEFLREFHKNPYDVMNKSPFKSKVEQIFSEEEIKNKSYFRKKFLSRYPINKEGMDGLNSISILFHGYKDILTNAFEIDEKPLKTVKLIEMPWSGYYWSMENGLLGYRYGDSKYNWQSNWEKRLNYVEKNPITDYLGRKIESLSPSEKYDLLIGNYETPITKAMWEEGKKEMATYNKIREWSGLCDGLAMASVRYPWPKYSIKVRSADGKHLIKFFPEDIKALGVYHWSGKNIPLRMLGGRCELPSPRTDSNGRVKEPTCLDPNPGSFHLALINRVGVQRKALIMDSSMDAEVWNYPIVSYTLSFYNPTTLKKRFKLTDAMIPLRDFQNDKFSEYRSRGAEFVVGVDAKIEYLTHKKPSQNDKDPSSDSSLISVLYRYDLELDAAGNIIGGEWYTYRHPDFLWFPDDNADPKAPFDYVISSEWNPSNESLPADWVESANSSAEMGLVSANILKKLFELSNKGN